MIALVAMCKFFTKWLLVLSGSCFEARKEKGGFEKNPNALWAGLDAALFLRDELLKKDGVRIWGGGWILFFILMGNLTLSMTTISQRILMKQKMF